MSQQDNPPFQCYEQHPRLFFLLLGVVHSADMARSGIGGCLYCTTDDGVAGSGGRNMEGVLRTSFHLWGLSLVSRVCFGVFLIGGFGKNGENGLDKGFYGFFIESLFCSFFPGFPFMGALILHNVKIKIP